MIDFPIIPLRMNNVLVLKHKVAVLGVCVPVYACAHLCAKCSLTIFLPVNPQSKIWSISSWAAAAAAGRKKSFLWALPWQDKIIPFYKGCWMGSFPLPSIFFLLTTYFCFTFYFCQFLCFQFLSFVFNIFFFYSIREKWQWRQADII